MMHVAMLQLRVVGCILPAACLCACIVHAAPSTLHYTMRHAAVPLQHRRLHAARHLFQCLSVRSRTAHRFGLSAGYTGPEVPYSEYFE